MNGSSSLIPNVNECSYCLIPVGSMFIECAECVEVYLCLKCFCHGVEFEEHEKSHDYRLHTKNTDSLVIFDCPNPWSASEELKLLDAVEQYGYGNWDEISEFMVCRSPAECRFHFDSYYVSGNIGNVLFTEEPILNTVDHTQNYGPCLSIPLPPISLSADDSKRLGFLPLRDEFEKEHMNDVEKFLSNLSINDDDSEIDKEFKYEALDIYRCILRERSELKQFARDNGYINFGLNNLRSLYPQLENESQSTCPFVLSSRPKRRRYAVFADEEQAAVTPPRSQTPRRSNLRRSHYRTSRLNSFRRKRGTGSLRGRRRPIVFSPLSRVSSESHAEDSATSLEVSASAHTVEPLLKRNKRRQKVEVSPIDASPSSITLDNDEPIKSKYRRKSTSSRGRKSSKRKSSLVNYDPSTAASDVTSFSQFDRSFDFSEKSSSEPVIPMQKTRKARKCRKATIPEKRPRLCHMTDYQLLTDDEKKALFDTYSR